VAGNSTIETSRSLNPTLTGSLFRTRTLLI
jgi:hypothetical protein